jgi:hypothetical protein
MIDPKCGNATDPTNERTPSVNRSTWAPFDRQAITKAIRAAFSKCRMRFSVDNAISTPALGIRIAKEFKKGINKGLGSYSLDQGPGNGHPDLVLRRLDNGRRFAFELRASGTFAPADRNRLVLISAIRKLLRHFPLKRSSWHILAIVLYERSQGVRQARIAIVGVQLDFIPPLWPVAMHSGGPRQKTIGNARYTS